MTARAVSRVGSGRSSQRIALLVAIVWTAAMWWYVTIAAPRPYYFTTDTGMEPDYYYNARLLAFGFPVNGTHHPGTPIYYLASWLMRLSGTALGSTQQFFNLSYVVVAVMIGAALSLFAWLLLHDLPLGTALLAISVLLAWPSALTYMNYFGADAFVVPAGLPTLTIFWKSLAHDRFRTGLAVLSGAGVGLCLAIKMSFVPLAVAVMIAGAMHAWRVRPAGTVRAIQALCAAPLTMVASFAVLTWPVRGQLPDILLNTMVREETRIESPNLVSAFVRTFGLLLRANWLLGAMIVLVIVGWLVACVRQWTLSRSSAAIAGREHCDWPAAAVFIALMGAAWSYTLGTVADDSRVITEYGILVRNSFPCALVWPFLVLFLDQTSRSQGVGWSRARPVQAALGAVGVVLILLSASTYAQYRQRFLTSRHEAIPGVMERLESQAIPGTRVAFWDGSPGDLFREASFHFFGNFSFAYDAFDQELTQRYPKITLFRLRDLKRLLPPRDTAPVMVSTSRPGWRHHMRQAVWDTWHRWFPGGVSERAKELVAGEQEGVQVSLVAFPEQESVELGSIPFSSVVDLIEQQLGPARVRYDTINGTRWTLVDVAGHSSQRLVTVAQ